MPLLMELRIAARRARRHFGVITIVVGSVSMAIAVNGALFAVLDGLLLRDLPFERPEQLVAVDYRVVSGRLPDLAYLPELAAERDELRRRLDTSALVSSASQVGFTSFFGPGANTAGVEATGVDSRFFRLLGLSPILGRTLDRSDESSPALLSRDSSVPLPVVIGYHLWLGQFGGNRDVLENVHELGGRRVRIVGILREGVKFPNETNVWAPVPAERGRPPALIRLAGGATMETLASSFPELKFTRLRDSVRPGDSRSIVLLFSAATLLVLVAWVQVAAIVWSGTVGRLNELGISLALGSGQLQLIRQFWIEGALAGCAALVIAWVSAAPLTTFIVSLLPETLRSGQYLAPSGRTFVFAGGLLLAGLGILSLVPVTLVRRASPVALLAGRIGTIRIGASRTRNAFLIGQMALTGCLLYMAGLVVHSHVRAETFDHGFDTEQVLVFWPPPTVRHGTSRDELRADIHQRERMLRASVDRLNASTAVVAASDVSAIHLTGLPDPMEETISHFDGRALHPVVRARSTGAGVTFLAALGGTLLAGHAFGDARYAGRRDVAIINETLAGLLSPPVTLMGVDVRTRVIGAEIRTKFFQGEIVGVMKDLVDSSPALPAQPQIFISSRHPNYAAGMITVNAREPLESTVPVIRSTLEEIWGPLPPRRFGLMNDELERALAPFRARSTLLSLIALFCLPLAAVGLTGALLLFVRSRERENAIRISLGAGPATVRRAVVGRSLLIVTLGFLPGIGLGASVAGVVAYQLFGVYPIDPLTILLVGVSFLALGWLAALVPSRRASELQVAQLLRSN